MRIRPYFLLAFALLLPDAMNAGVIILDGTDSGDHGSAGAGGWLYMKAALNNIAGQLTPGGNLTLSVLGTTPGSQADSAISWAFSNSNLPGLGWTQNDVSVANLGTYLSGLTAGNTGILYVPTIGNVTGDLPSSALATLGTYASVIDTFLVDGGGLFAQSESPSSGTSFSWVTSLLPGFTATDAGTGGNSNAISLTPAGNFAFPGLTNADLSTGPWHNYFGGNLGALQVLGTSTSGGTVPVIVGVSNPGASFTNPGVPEPSTLAILPVAAGIFYWRRRRRA